MGRNSLYDQRYLASQIRRQSDHRWTLENGISWKKGIDPTKPFLPLDKDCIAFPGANEKQRLALSQIFGLVINSTISEMEGVIHKLKSTAWREILNSRPVNPEMQKLGELFFEEEAKHSLVFAKYNKLFCETLGIAEADLSLLLPKAFGSHFQKAIIENAKNGGHAFWWVVASVEEVSISLFKDLVKFKADCDPLYFEIHSRHVEDEARHKNYAYLMLELIYQKRFSFSGWWHKNLDLMTAQRLNTQWVLAEFSKFLEIARVSKNSEFLKTLESCLPLLKKQTLPKLIWSLFVTAPYVSPMLNLNYQKETLKNAAHHHIPRFPFPKRKAPV